MVKAVAARIFDVAGRFIAALNKTVTVFDRACHAHHRVRLHLANADDGVRIRDSLAEHQLLCNAAGRIFNTDAACKVACGNAKFRLDVGKSHASLGRAGICPGDQIRGPYSLQRRNGTGRWACGERRVGGGAMRPA